MTSLPDESHIAKARAIIMKYGWNSSAYQILNKGMNLWFSNNWEAVIGFQDFGEYRIVAGAPVCALADLPSVLDEFHRDARRIKKQLVTSVPVPDLRLY